MNFNAKEMMLFNKLCFFRMKIIDLQLLYITRNVAEMSMNIIRDACSEGKTSRLIKRHHCFFYHFLFKASLPHDTQVVLALQFQYLWDSRSNHCYLL